MKSSGSPHSHLVDDVADFFRGADREDERSPVQPLDLHASPKDVV